MPNTLAWVLAIGWLSVARQAPPPKGEADAAVNAKEQPLPSPKSLTFSQEVANLTKEAGQGTFHALRSFDPKGQKTSIP